LTPSGAYTPEGDGIMRKSYRKTILTVIITVLVFIAGISVMLYPVVSDYINSRHQSRVVANYLGNLANIDDDSAKQMLEAAQAYNEGLANKENRFIFSDEDRAQYDQLLNPNGDEVMGVLEIPAINVNLPIYHGTSDGVLQIGTGHLEGSSLPVGGPGTHAVITGHTGLPSSTLLSNLDQLVIGDTFTLYVLNETLTYQVDQIVKVDPNDASPLAIVPGMDYCTLATCTPIGLNTQRLAVRGHRVLEDNNNDNSYRNIVIFADARLIERIRVAAVLFVPFVIGLVVFFRLRYRKIYGKRRNELRKQGERN